MARSYIKLKDDKGEMIDSKFKAKGVYMDIELSCAELAYQNGSGPGMWLTAVLVLA